MSPGIYNLCCIYCNQSCVYCRIF